MWAIKRKDDMFYNGYVRLEGLIWLKHRTIVYFDIKDAEDALYDILDLSPEYDLDCEIIELIK